MGITGVGPIGNMGGPKEFEPRSLSKEGIHDTQPFQSINSNAFLGSRRRAVDASGSNIQSAPNIGGFTHVDRHNLYVLATDRERTIALSEDIYFLRQLLRANPDRPWKEVAASFPFHPGVDASIGRMFLEQRFTRFVSSRQALRFWQEKYTGDQVGTTAQITELEHLDIPEGISIKRVAFRTNACALFMRPEDITTYDRYLDKRSGLDISDNYDAGAFIASNLYLEDDKGNRCAIIIVPYYEEESQQEWVHETLLHEEEHTVFRYYQNKLLKPSTLKADKRTSFTLKALDALRDVNTASMTSVENILIPRVRNVLSKYRLLFYNEMVVSGASFPIDLGQIEGIAEDFDPVKLSYDIGNIYQYADSMMQKIDGLLDSLRSTALSDRQKIEVWWNIEKKVAQFTLQNYTIGRWLEELWQAGNEDSERFVSRMYAVSITKPWNIGWFIDEDPQKMHQDLFKEPNTAKIIRRMMMRNMQKINTTAIQPQKEICIKNILEVIQERLSDFQKLDEQTWRSTVQELFLSYYLPTYIQMAQVIFPAQEKLIQDIKEAGIADIDPYAAVKFTNEYLDYFFNNRSILRAIESFFLTPDMEYQRLRIQDKWTTVKDIQTDSGQTLGEVVIKEKQALWDRAGYEGIPIF